MSESNETLGGDSGVGLKSSGEVLIAASHGRRRGGGVVPAAAGLRLTQRDIELLQFLHEQQFASLAMIYFRFFDRRRSANDAIPTNFWVTRQRLALLKHAGLITSQKIYTEGKALYLLTRTGYELLKTRVELGLYAEPLARVDFRYYEHDKRVTLCRIALEREGKSFKWYPDRFLRQKRGYPHGEDGFVKLPTGVIPDGVFVSSKGERVSLELELTPKKRERYAEKRAAYGQLLSGKGMSLSEGPALNRVLFVACSDRIGKDLQEFFQAHSESGFRVYSYEALVGGVLGREALVL